MARKQGVGESESKLGVFLNCRSSVLQQVIAMCKASPSFLGGRVGKEGGEGKVS